MNVLFILTLSNYANIKKPILNQGSINLGLSYVSTLLKKNKHITELLVLTRETKKVMINKSIKLFKPDIICFTSASSEYNFVREIAKYIKETYPRIHLIIGGPHPTLNPESVIKDDFDSLCIGEGEYPFLELAEALREKKSIKNIKNLWVKEKGKTYKNKTRKFLQDLDSLGFPDREIWQKWIAFPKSRPSVLLGRGCPFKCTYCANHYYATTAKGQYVRTRTVKSIIDEIKYIKNKYYWTEEIYLEIETIILNTKFSEELFKELKKLKQEYPEIWYGVNLRVVPKLNYLPYFKAMREANIKYVNIGLESGSKRIREKILNRHYENKDIIDCAFCAKQEGIEVFLYTMMGLPTETMTDFKKTVKVCRKIQPKWVYVHFFYPYPGTKIYEQYSEKKIYGKKRALERKYQTIKLHNFKSKDIKKEYYFFYWNVYKGKKPIVVVILYTLFQFISSNYTLNKFYRSISTNKNIQSLIRKIMNLK